MSRVTFVQPKTNIYSRTLITPAEPGVVPTAGKAQVEIRRAPMRVVPTDGDDGETRFIGPGGVATRVRIVRPNAPAIAGAPRAAVPMASMSPEHAELTAVTNRARLRAARDAAAEHLRQLDHALDDLEAREAEAEAEAKARAEDEARAAFHGGAPLTAPLGDIVGSQGNTGDSDAGSGDSDHNDDGGEG